MNSPEPLRAAVVGVGMMGQNHVRVYREISGVQLVGVADPDVRLRDNMAQQHHIRAYENYRDLFDVEKPHLVTIAVPTVFHAEVAREAIQRGIHVLIEKPITETQEDGRALIDLAQQHGVILTIGHIERHNPVVQALKARLDTNQLGQIFEIRAERVGPFPARIRDVGVVLDLATHDIDVIRYLVGDIPIRVYAETQQNIHSTREDLLSGIMRFKNGITALLQVNWLTPTKSRRLMVTGAAGMYEIDYLTQDLTFYENGSALDGFSSLQFLRGVTEGRMIREKIEKREPLRLELEDFIRAVRTKGTPNVTGQDSLIALSIAHALVKSGQKHQVVEVQFA